MKRILIGMLTMVMALAMLAGCGGGSDTASDPDENSKLAEEKFPEFEGTDLDGNAVDSSIFKGNRVTVVNFWFNTCPPCIEELDDLSELNEELKAEGGAVIGMNVDTFDGDKEQIAEAKKILKSRGAEHLNIWLSWDSEAGEFASGIFAFPTTYVVDSEGNIVGEPLMGGIEDPQILEQLRSQIEQATAAE